MYLQGSRCRKKGCREFLRCLGPLRTTSPLRTKLLWNRPLRLDPVVSLRLDLGSSPSLHQHVRVDGTPRRAPGKGKSRREQSRRESGGSGRHGPLQLRQGHGGSSLGCPVLRSKGAEVVRSRFAIKFFGRASIASNVLVSTDKIRNCQQCNFAVNAE